jgi:hypothetical protein
MGRTTKVRFSVSASNLFTVRLPWASGLFASICLFKPTPCRGVGHVLYATLARVRRPATGRLNSGVRRQKSVWWLCIQHGDFPGFGWHCSSVGFMRRFFFGQVRLARSHIAYVALARFGNEDWCGQFSHN